MTQWRLIVRLAGRGIQRHRAPAGLNDGTGGSIWALTRQGQCRIWARKPQKNHLIPYPLHRRRAMTTRLVSVWTFADGPFHPAPPIRQCADRTRTQALVAPERVALSPKEASCGSRSGGHAPWRRGRFARMGHDVAHRTGVSDEGGVTTMTATCRNQSGGRVRHAPDGFYRSRS